MINAVLHQKIGFQPMQSLLLLDNLTASPSNGTTRPLSKECPILKTNSKVSSIKRKMKLTQMLHLLELLLLLLHWFLPLRSQYDGLNDLLQLRHRLACRLTSAHVGSAACWTDVGTDVGSGQTDVDPDVGGPRYTWDPMSIQGQTDVNPM